MKEKTIKNLNRMMFLLWIFNLYITYFMIAVYITIEKYPLHLLCFVPVMVISGLVLLMTPTKSII
jgi:hypothetical protein